MKKRFIRILDSLMLAIFAVAMATSCSNDDKGTLLIDATPVSIQLYIVDAQGNDLLDADFDGNILDSGITATFDGKEYALTDIAGFDPDTASPMARSRAIAPMFYGLYILNPDMQPGITNYGHNLLCFGEFEGFRNFDHSVVFHIPATGRDITVRMVSVARMNGDDLDWDIAYYIDGEKVADDQAIMNHGIKVVVD